MSQVGHSGLLVAGRALARHGVAAGAVLVVLAGAVAGAVQGPGLAVLVLAAGALGGTIAALWSSLRAVLGETPLGAEDAFSLGAPSAAQEQKHAVLRALKDLELERSVGKISARDYDELSARYRGDARRLLQALDDEAAPARRTAERLVQGRLAREGLLGEADPESAASTPAALATEGGGGAAARCAGCGAPSDADAVFCKKCGRRLRRRKERP